MDLAGEGKTLDFLRDFPEYRKNLGESFWEIPLNVMLMPARWFLRV